MWFRQAPTCVFGGLGGSGGGCFLREGGDSRGAARLPVLSPGLSLDPKPKVVRPKTKTYFPKGSKMSLNSYPVSQAGEVYELQVVRVCASPGTADSDDHSRHTCSSLRLDRDQWFCQRSFRCKRPKLDFLFLGPGFLQVGWH